MRLVLASASASRRQMLDAAGVPFEVRLPAFDEEEAKAALRARGLGAASLAPALAEAKAAAVTAGPGELVLGADQTLELEDGAMLDKPASQDELAAQLRRLSGRTHKLHAAAAVVEGGQTAWRDVVSVTMHVRPLGDVFVGRYVDAEYETVRWSVGGYHVEGRGAQLFERIDGSHFAVQGLPLLPLLCFLRSRALILT